MEDLSLHILDIAENALRAEATRIEISLHLDPAADRLVIEIRDNGSGMAPDAVARVYDPFFTTKGKKTGLGIPLLAQAARQAGGDLEVGSRPGEGTRVRVVFQWSHLDRPALGNVAGTVLTIIAGHPEVDVLYEERKGSAVARLDTAAIKQELEGVPINDPAVLSALRSLLAEEFILKNEGTIHE